MTRTDTTRTLAYVGLHPIGGAANKAVVGLAQSSGRFTIIGMNTAHTAHTAALFNTGGILVAGGAAAEGTLTNAQLHTPWPARLDSAVCICFEEA